jgi:hypothetical protein
MKKFIRYSSIALLSASLVTSVNAALSDTVGLTGTIATAISVDVPAASTTVTMTNGVVTTQNLTVASNVDFTIAVASLNGSELEIGSSGTVVVYTFTLKNAAPATILSAVGISGTQSPVSATWTFNVTPTGIDGSTAAGTYTDTITITVAAA